MRARFVRDLNVTNPATDGIFAGHTFPYPNHQSTDGPRASDFLSCAYAPRAASMQEFRLQADLPLPYSTFADPVPALPHARSWRGIPPLQGRWKTVPCSKEETAASDGPRWHSKGDSLVFLIIRAEGSESLFCPGFRAHLTLPYVQDRQI